MSIASPKNIGDTNNILLALPMVRDNFTQIVGKANDIAKERRSFAR
jgi:hypothetical protein